LSSNALLYDGTLAWNTCEIFPIAARH